MKEFENRVAIVTGTTGIGRAITKRLAVGGCTVLACGIESSANQELEQESGASGLTIRVEHCDVSQPDQVQAVVAKTAVEEVVAGVANQSIGVVGAGHDIGVAAQ